MGIEEEKIIVTGIPIRAEFFESKKSLSNFSLPKEDTVLMIMGGGMGLIPEDKSFYQWLNSLKNLTTLVLTGKNDNLFESISQLELENIIPLRYTNEVAYFMEQSDLLITKAGGITFIKLSMIGEYYSAITPFATGGQPMQIYLLNNAGVQVGTASSLMVTKLLVYQIVVTLYSIFMFIIKFNFLLKEAKLSFPFVMIGCLFNFIVVLTILGLFYNEKLIRKILSKLLLFGNRLNLIKDIKKSEDKLNMNILDYKASIDSMKEDKKTTLILIITTFVQLTFYFS